MSLGVSGNQNRTLSPEKFRTDFSPTVEREREDLGTKDKVRTLRALKEVFPVLFIFQKKQVIKQACDQILCSKDAGEETHLYLQEQELEFLKDAFSRLQKESKNQTNCLKL